MIVHSTGDLMTEQKLENKYEINITKNAAKKILDISDQQNKTGFGLRLNMVPGGCSGFTYGMDFVKEPEKTDIVIEQNNVKLFLDADSMDMLKGIKVDYVESLQGSGFNIENPNIKSSCGCGKSVC